MRIFVTGGTGFVGSHLIRHLVSAGHHVRCLARNPQPKSSTANIEYHLGDTSDPASLQSGAANCDAVIHLVGIIREFPRRHITFERLHVEATRNVIAASQQAGIKRYLHMSANGVSETATGGYLSTKWRAEQLVRNSGLDWTIFRPSLIYGPGGDFTHMLSQQVRFLPVIPVIGDGRYRLSPVCVDDVAHGYVKALTTPGSIGHSYHCCGPTPCSYDELIDLFAAILGRRAPFKLHHPLGLIRGLTRYLESFACYPVTSDQIAMLLQGNVCDPQPWAQALGLTPTPLEEGIKKALTG